MSKDNFDLSALLSSRICHDLISPLGAVSNGLELLSMTGQPHSPEFKLISDSIDNATSKIRFFRVAYGSAPRGVTLAMPEIRSVLADNFRGSRIEVHWHPSHEIQRHDVKTAFLAIQCLETALPYGGRIDVYFDQGGYKITADAEKMRIVAAHWAGLLGQDVDLKLTAALVQFGVLQEMTRWRKPSLEALITDDRIVLKF